MFICPLFTRFVFFERSLTIETMLLSFFSEFDWTLLVRSFGAWTCVSRELWQEYCMSVCPDLLWTFCSKLTTAFWWEYLTDARQRHLLTLLVLSHGTKTTTNNTSYNSRQLLICVFLRFVPRLEQHGCERCAFGKSVSCFFGAETDNDERLVNRAKPRLKTNGILLGFFRTLLGWEN